MTVAIPAMAANALTPIRLSQSNAGAGGGGGEDGGGAVRAGGTGGEAGGDAGARRTRGGGRRHNRLRGLRRRNDWLHALSRRNDRRCGHDRPRGRRPVERSASRAADRGNDRPRRLARHGRRRARRSGRFPPGLGLQLEGVQPRSQQIDLVALPLDRRDEHLHALARAARRHPGHDRQYERNREHDERDQK